MAIKKGLAVLSAAMLPLLFATPAQAQDGQMFTAQLGSLNGTETTGTAKVMWDGGQAQVEIMVSGAEPDAPHAQHIHILDSGDGSCPSMDAAGDDGILDTTEGAPSYGPIRVSLTTEGDTSPDSGLAVDRMPASADGDYTYSRTVDIPAEFAERLADGVIVVHGIDTINPSGEYDGDPKSELDPSLPQEATAPAACGALEAMPVGGSDTGDGAPGSQSLTLFGLGGAALVAATGLLIQRRRRVTDQP